MNDGQTNNIIIRTYDPKDKQGIYLLFKSSLQSVIEYGKLNYTSLKKILHLFLEKYEKSKTAFFLIILFHIVNLKIFLIHLFNNNTIYYYLFWALFLATIWIIFSFCYLKFFSYPCLNSYIDTAMNIDFKNPEEWLKEGISHLWVACHNTNEEIIGSIGVIPYEKEKDLLEIQTNGNKTAELKRMYVSRNHLRKGIASKLYRELEYWCIKNGYDEIVLSTSSYQVDAISFYEKNGFRVTNRVKSDFKYPNFVILNKSLKDKKDD